MDAMVQFAHLSLWTSAALAGAASTSISRVDAPVAVGSRRPGDRRVAWR